ncbi:MAG: hypothetical protein HZA80_02485 [Candidatus Taylorbacteria bacterium]|nr:hypothetical protein [Candidatus Taylorbacteria bacterium]
MRKGVSILILLICAVIPALSLAQEFNSSSFKVLDPIIAPGGSGFSSSGSFQMWGTVAEIAQGRSLSALYTLGGGFLRYPYVSTPTVSATPGSGQVSLTWTSAQGLAGWTAEEYRVGKSTSSGGPYTYTDVGNVLSSTVTGLSNGTTYYFVVVVQDAFGNAIATSTQISSTPVASSGSGGGGGGGGGGGSVAPSVGTGVVLSGRAFPLSRVTVLKDGQVAITTIAGPDSNFSVTLSGISEGNYTFSVYGEDSNQVRSHPFTFPIFITSGVTTQIGGIFIAPTIAVDKSEVKKGDNIVIFGQSVPSSDITISVHSEEELFIKKKSDANGVYLLNFNSAVLEKGKHETKSKAAIEGEVSSFGTIVGFLVGDKNVPITVVKKGIKGDLNRDDRVNLVDFSIAAFWYKKQLSTQFKVIEGEKLNADDKIDLVDFSIMAFYWTG